MQPARSLWRILAWACIVFLQLIMTQVVTFAASFAIPAVDNVPQIHPALFAAFLGLTFSAGVFIAGWLGLRWGWLPIKPLLLARGGAALLGAWLPLGLALLVFGRLEPGNPFFLVSILLSIVCFYLPGWVGKGK